MTLKPLKYCNSWMKSFYRFRLDICWSSSPKGRNAQGSQFLLRYLDKVTLQQHKIMFVITLRKGGVALVILGNEQNSNSPLLYVACMHELEDDGWEPGKLAWACRINYYTLSLGVEQA